MTLTPAIFYCQSKILVKEMHMPDMAFPRVVFPEKAFSYWHRLFLFIREGFSLICIGYCFQFYWKQQKSKDTSTSRPRKRADNAELSGLRVVIHYIPGKLLNGFR